MSDKTMTSVRFGDNTRRLIDILTVEEMDSMSGVLERAVKYYYNATSVQRLEEMIYEYEGRMKTNTGLIQTLADGRVKDALERIRTQKSTARGVAKLLLAEIENRIKLLGA